MQINKTCGTCSLLKSLNEFYKHSGSPDGRRSTCKECDYFRQKKYESENRDLVNARHKSWKERNLQKVRILGRLNQSKRRVSIPWEQSFYMAKQRCENPKRERYVNYGGRGIKFLLTMEQVKELWVRDKGGLLKRPSIDRIDTNGHYKFSNCRFIELNENSKKRNLENRTGNDTPAVRGKTVKASA